MLLMPSTAAAQTSLDLKPGNSLNADKKLGNRTKLTYSVTLP